MMRVTCGEMEHKGVEAGQITQRCTASDVLATIADKYLKSVNPSSGEEFETFAKYMEKMNLILVGSGMGSLLITVWCNSLRILEDLGREYCSGHLGEMVQSSFASEYILDKFHLSKLELKTTIRKEDYEACKQHFKQTSGNISTPSVENDIIPDEETSKSTSHSIEEDISMKEDIS